jgi:hypothetical protein
MLWAFEDVVSGRHQPGRATIRAGWGNGEGTEMEISCIPLIPYSEKSIQKVKIITCRGMLLFSLRCGMSICVCYKSRNLNHPRSYLHWCLIEKLRE